MIVGFIGVGTMASAIAQGLISHDTVPASNVVGYDKHAEYAQIFSERTGARTVGTIGGLVAEADIVVLSVKPDVVPVVLREVGEHITSTSPVIVSIAAGVTLDKLSTHLGEGGDRAIVRVMPNLNVTVGAGTAGICANAHTSEKQLEDVVRIFESVGQAFVIEESLFSAYTAIAGSSPAWTYLYIDSLARGAVKRGMPKALATEIAASAVLGSAKLLLEDGRSPWDLIDAVCSPGGTTVAGLMAMEDRGFIGAVVAGVEATVDRDIELGSD